MSQETGENELGLHRILDFLRMAGLLVLGLHFYCQACPSCKAWQGDTPIADRLMTALADTGMFSDPLGPKLLALALLGVSVLGARGKKNPALTLTTALSYLFAGLFLYFSSGLLLD